MVLLRGGRLRSVVCVALAVEDPDDAESCDGGLKVVGLVRVVTDEFVRE